MSVLLSHGFPLVFELYSNSVTNFKEIETMIAHVVKKYEVNGTFAPLLDMKYTLDFAKKKFTFTTPVQV